MANFLSPVLGEGVYTIPDASRILSIPQHKLRRWVTSYWKTISQKDKVRIVPVIDAGIWGEKRERAFNFFTLIEIYSIMKLRELGVSFNKIKIARNELKKRFDTQFPFASNRLMSDGKKVLIEFDESGLENILTLGTGGQLAFKKIIEPFCEKLDFSEQTELVEKYWPLGKGKAVVVDPHHGFGRPTIENTNITTETLYDLIRAGEDIETVAELYKLETSFINDSIEFETRKAA